MRDQVVIDYQNGKAGPEDLLKKYDRLIAFFLWKKHVDPKDHEDLMQECRIVMFKLAERFDPGRNVKFSSFLLSNLRAVTRDYYRRKVEVTDEIPDNGYSYEPCLILPRLKNAIDSLPYREKEILKRYIFDGEPMLKIEKDMKVSCGYFFLNRAIKHIRIMLEGDFV